mmetsp:Transcript_102792/g.297172  ORF Transcript_102792/g.297172 Transcript_102792/m.297172 type:complete len:278 (+) Transcript_102792:85-918(+)
MITAACMGNKSRRATSFLGFCSGDLKPDIELYDSDDSDTTRSDLSPSDTESDTEAIGPLGVIDLVWQMLKMVPQYRWQADLPKRTSLQGAQTVIFFDWDDTLLCTSFISRLGHQDRPFETSRRLRVVASSVRKLLKKARALGQTLIVTNAEEGWVQHSSRLYLPKALPELDGLPIISARSRFEPHFPDDTASWKTHAFLELGKQLDTSRVTNLVSLGDSFCEVLAVHALGQRFAESVVKTVRFKSAPTPDELQDQLDVTSNILERVVLSASSLDIVL